MIKKVLILLMAVLGPVVHAREFTYNDIIYTVIDETAKTCSATGAKDKYNSSIELSKKPVEVLGDDSTVEYTLVCIGDSAFQNNFASSVVIPESVTSIGEKAFCRSSLLEIDIPSSVTHIGQSAFYSCRSLERVTLPEGLDNIEDATFYCCDKLTSINIPKTIKRIGKRAFMHTASLKDIDLPEGLLVIDDDAFNSFNGSKLKLPESVVTIGDRAFYWADYLWGETIHFSNTLTFIGEQAFYNSAKYFILGNSITHIGDGAFGNYLWGGAKVAAPEGVMPDVDHYIHFPEEDYVIDDDGFIYSKDRKILYGAPSILPTTDFTIPEGVVEIRDWAFSSCYVSDMDDKSLQSITIPNSVRTIGRYAFSNCRCLKQVKFSDNLHSIGEYAFSECDIETLILPSALEEIGTHAFYRNKGLDYVYIPSSVRKIDLFPFYKDNLYGDPIRRIEFESLEGLCGIEYSNYSANPMSQATEIFVAGEEIIDVEIPSSVHTLGDYTFWWCPSLKSIKLNKVTTIGRECFFRCKNLASIDFGEVTEILPRAFIDNTSLQEVSSGKIEWIGDSAFMNNTSLQYVSGGKIQRVGNSAFAGCSALKDFSFDSVIEIGERAFEHCSSLTSARITPSVTALGRSSFFGCTALKELYFDNDILKSPSPFKGSGVEKVIFGETMTAIPASMFNSCTHIKEIDIPDNIKEIGAFAFASCSELERLNLGNGLETIANFAFTFCESLTELKIPASLTSIQEYAFDRSGLTKFDVPSLKQLCGMNIKVDSPLKHLYVNGTEVADVIIPEGVENISDYVFQGLAYITSVKIPASVKKIGCDAFYRCSSIVKVEYQSIDALLGIEMVTANSNPMYSAGNADGAYLYFAGSDMPVNDLVIPEGVEEIQRYTFGGGIFRRVKMPMSIEKIGLGAFAHCDVSAVDIPNAQKWALTEFEDIDSNPMHGRSSKVSTYLSPKAVPCSLYINGKLVDFLHIELDGYDISPYAFSGAKIKYLAVKARSIGEKAFHKCSDLSQIMLYVNDRIEPGAFTLCESLYRVYSSGYPPSINNNYPTVFSLPRGISLYCGGDYDRYTLFWSMFPNIYNGWDGKYNPVLSKQFNRDYTELEFDLNSYEKITDVKIEPSVMALEQGLNHQLTVRVWINNVLASSEQPVKWSSDDESVVTVSESGNVVAVGVGSTTVRATVGRVEGTCEIMVVEGEPWKVIVDGAIYKIDPETNSATLTSYTNSINSVVIPAEVSYSGISYPVDKIGYRALDNSKIRSLTIPATIKEVGNEALSRCYNLEELIFEDSDEPILGSSHLINETPVGYLYLGRPLGEENSNWLFRKDIKKVVFGGNISEMPSVYGCQPLECVELQAPIKAISHYGFYECYSLKEVILPPELESIDYQAFTTSSGINRITVHAVVPPVFLSQYNNFAEVVYNNATLYVPAGSVDLYRNAPVWKNFIHIEEIASSGIDNIGVDCETLTVFDLLGRRVLTDAPASMLDTLRPGVYIVNGCKMLIPHR